MEGVGVSRVQRVERNCRSVETIIEGAEPSELTVAIRSGFAGVSALQSPWQDLHARSDGRSTVFQSYAWNTIVAEAAEREGPGRTPMVVEVRQGPEIIALIPLMVEDKHGARVATWMGEPQLQYGDMIVAVEPEDRAKTPGLATILFEALVASDLCDVLHLRSVRDDAAVKPFLEQHGRIAGNGRTAPAIDLTAFANYDDYLKSLNAKSRKSRRRNRKKFAGQGQLSVHIKPPAQFDEPIVQTALDLKSRWLEQRGETSRTFSDKSAIALFADLANHLPKTVVSCMKCDDAVAAVEIGFLDNCAYYSFLGAVNEDFTSFGPGSLLLEDTISWSFDQGVRTFDFLAPEDPYKRSWAHSDVTVHDYAVPLTVKGSLYASAVIEWGLPAAKALWGHLPASVRRSLVKALV